MKKLKKNARKALKTRRQRTQFLGLVESLEPRLLLANIQNSWIEILQQGADGMVGFGDRVSDSGYLSQPVRGLKNRDGSSINLGDLAPIGGSIDEGIANPIREYFDQPAPPQGYTTEELVLSIDSEPTVLSIVEGYTDAAVDEIYFEVHLRKHFDVNDVDIDFGLLGDQYIINARFDLQMDIDIQVDMYLTFGIYLDSSLSIEQSFFIRDVSIETKAMVNGVSNPFTLQVGVVEVAVPDVTFDGLAVVQIGTDRPGFLDTILLSEMNSTDPSLLVSNELNGDDFSYFFDIDFELGSFRIQDTRALRLYGEMLGNEPLLEWSVEFARLLPFASLTIEQVTSGMEQFGSWLTSVGRTDLFNARIPFTSQATVGSSQDFGAGLTPFLSSLRNSSGQVAFDSAQDFPYSGNNGLTYDEATTRLSFTVSQPLQAQRARSRRTTVSTDSLIGLESNTQATIDSSGNVRFVASFDLNNGNAELNDRMRISDIRIDSVMLPRAEITDGLMALQSLGIEYDEASLGGEFAILARLGDPDPAVRELSLRTLFDRLNNGAQLLRNPIQYTGEVSLEWTGLSVLGNYVNLDPLASIRASVSNIVSGAVKVEYENTTALADFENLSLEVVIRSIRDSLNRTTLWSSAGGSALAAVGQSILDYANLKQDSIADLIDDLRETFVPTNETGRPLLQDIPAFMSSLPLGTLYSGLHSLSTSLSYDAVNGWNTSLDLSLGAQPSVPVGIAFETIYSNATSDPLSPSLERTDNLVGTPASVTANGSSRLQLKHQMDVDSNGNPVGYLLNNSSWISTAYANASASLGTPVTMSGASGLLGMELVDGAFVIAGDIASPSSANPARFASGFSTQTGRTLISALPTQPPATLSTGGLKLDVGIIPEVTGAVEPNRFHVQIGNLALPSSTTDLIGTPSFPTLRTQISLLDHLSSIPPSVSAMLGKLADQLEKDVFGIPLPLIGSHLDEAASFVRDLKEKFDNTFDTLSQFSTSDIENAINDAIGNLLNQPGDYVTFNGNVTGEVRFQVLITGAPISETVSANTDLGLPALGIALETDLGVLGTYTFGFDIVVSVDEGVYIDTTNETIRMDLDINASGSAVGRLGWLAVSATIMPAVTGSAAFHAEFVVDMTDPNQDGMLKPSELASGSLIDFDRTTLDADADFKIEFDANVSAWLPSIRGDLDIEWSFVGPDLDGNVPEIEFSNVEIVVGTFLTQILSPVLEKLDPILDALDPVLDVLSANLPVLDDLGVDVSLISIAQEIVDLLPGALKAQFELYLDLIQVLIDLRDLVDAIDLESGSGLVIPLGSLRFGGADRSFYDARLGELVQDVFQFVSNPGDWFQAFQGAAPKTAAIIEATPASIDFPFLDDPKSVFEWLLGKGQAELVTLKLPGFQMDIPFDIPIPIIPGILNASIFGSIGVGFGLMAGIDTYGAKDFFKSGDPADLLKGFYISDRENADGTGEDVLELPVTGKALAGLGVGFDVGGVGLSATVGGGIEATIGIDLIDPNNDGKVRGHEWDSPEGCMAIQGGISVILEAQAIIGIFPYDFPLAKKELGSFNKIIYCGQQNQPTGSISTLDPNDGTLTLLMGPRAQERTVEKDVEDETFVVKQVGEFIQVWAFGKVDVYNYVNVREIYADGGTGNDRISIDPDVTWPVVLLGGSGDDWLVAGSRQAVLAGGDGDDWIVGSSVVDLIHGNDGNDRIWGRAGDDTIYAGNGDDEVDGEDGNDVIFVGEGINRAKGGTGRDRMTGGSQRDVFYGGEDGDFLFGFEGDDVLLGEGGEDEIEGGDGIDLIDGGDGNDPSLRGGRGNDRIRGGAGNDSLFGDEDDDYLEGSDGDDVLHGGVGILIAFGNGGNDLIYGGSLDDILHGDDGIDEIYGYAGADKIFGGADGDFLYGGGDNDSLFGEGGSDVLHGALGNDELDGGSGDDFLYGNSDDIHEAAPPAGTSDNDRLIGGDGADAIVGGFGIDYIEGGSGPDTLQGNEDSDVIYGGSGADIIYGHDAPTFQRGNTDGQDFLFGEGGSDTIYGGAGDDVIRGGLDVDYLFGEDGEDKIFGDQGKDEISGGRDIDTIDGGTGDDTIQGGTGGDKLFGNDGTDIIEGFEGNDFISGNDGGDFLYGNDGMDDLRGGIGDDELHGNDGDDDLYGNEGLDKLYGGIGSDFMEGGADNDYLEGNEGPDEIYGEEGDDVAYGNDGADEVYGGPGSDKLFGGTGEDVIRGGRDDDYIEGNEDPDEIYGEEGNDVAYGNEGDDDMDGGLGNDTLRGGNGIDTIDGDLGDDLILGNDGDDILMGGSGQDVVRGGFGEDVMSGDLGNDRLYGEEDDDQLSGGDGDDVLEGGDGNDVLAGDGGADALYGDRGVDQLDGGNGNDFLFAGHGIGDTLLGGAGDDEIVGSDDGKDDPKFDDAIRFGDVIDGGDGHDVIYGLGGGDQINGGTGNDVIYGGTHGDRIVAGVDAIVAPAVDNDLVYGGDGDDIIFGGDGNDALRGGNGTNTIDGGLGINDIDLTGAAPTPLSNMSRGLERRGAWAELSNSATGYGITSADEQTVLGNSGIGGLEQAVLMTDTRVYVAWVDWRNGNTEIYVAYHPIGYGTWTELPGFGTSGSASGGGISNDAQQSRRPTLFQVKNTSEIFVAWTSIDENGASTIEVASELNSWARIANPGNSGTADHPVAVSYFGNAAILAWIETRNGVQRAVMSQYIYAPGCYAAFSPKEVIAVNAAPGDQVTAVDIASVDTQVVFALEIGAGDDRDIQIATHRSVTQVNETTLCPSVPNASVSSYVPGTTQVIYTRDLDDTTQPTIGMQFIDTLGQNENETELVAAWHRSNDREDQVEGVAIRLSDAAVGNPRPLIPQYLANGAPLLNAGSVSNTLGYASDPDLAVNYSHSFLTWRDDGVRSMEGGRASIFILGRDRELDVAAPYVLKENRLFDATERGISVTGGEVQTISTSVPEFGYGFDSPVVVWTEARARSQPNSIDAPTSGVYLRVTLSGLALSDDSAFDGKTGAMVRNLFENDSNLFGEIPARITHFDGRELPSFGDEEDSIQFRSLRGALVTIFTDGRVNYDPRGVVDFLRLRVGESITESFVYTVNNFIHRAEALATFTVEGSSRWHNSTLPVDVLRNGFVDPLDALVLINFLNAYGARNLDDAVDGGRSDHFLDVDNDGTVSPLDVLIVINWINSRTSGGEGEGEDGAYHEESRWLVMAAGSLTIQDDMIRRKRGEPGLAWIGRDEN
jgi:Ca2+-binding RTX toxin-like protein